MAWALVNTNECKLEYWFYNEKLDIPTYEQKTIDAAPGTICNLIVYDGQSDYKPQDGYKLESVPDNAKIGDTGY